MKSKILAIEIRVREDAPDFVIPGIMSTLTEIVRAVLAETNTDPAFAGLIEMEVLNDDTD